MVAPPAQKPMLLSLQACRIVGAVAVVIFHTAISARAYGMPPPDWAERAVHYFPIAIDFFFVASGFIVYYVSEPMAGQSGSIRHYFELRLSRVFITYLPIGLGLAALYVLLPWARGAEHHWTWFTTLTLLPSDGQAALIPAWTLQHELAFFLILGAAFAIKRPLLTMMVWAIVLLAVRLPIGPGENPFLSLANLDFVWGVFAAAALRKGWSIRAGTLWFIAGLAAAAHIVIGAPIFSPVAGIGFASLMVLMVRADLVRPLRLPVWLAVVADSTFAIYLVNLPLISIVLRAGHRVGANWLPAALVGLAASFLAGVAYYLAYERRAIGWARTGFDRAHAARLAIALNTADEPPVPPVVQTQPGLPPAAASVFQITSPANHKPSPGTAVRK